MTFVLTWVLSLSEGDEDENRSRVSLRLYVKKEGWSLLRLRTRVCLRSSQAPRNRGKVKLMLIFCSSFPFLFLPLLSLFLLLFEILTIHKPKGKKSTLSLNFARFSRQQHGARRSDYPKLLFPGSEHTVGQPVCGEGRLRAESSVHNSVLVTTVNQTLLMMKSHTRFPL